MTSQTYNTRVLTARDHELIDRLQANPRFRALGDRLRPPPPKPAPKRPKAEDEVMDLEDGDRVAAKPVSKPVPKGG